MSIMDGGVYHIWDVYLASFLVRGRRKGPGKAGFILGVFCVNRTIKHFIE